MVRRLLVLVGVLVCTLASAPAFAAQVYLRVHYRTMELGQQGQAEIVVVNGRTTVVPDLPVDDGLVVRFAGQQRATRSVNLHRTRSVSFTYSVKATRTGSFTLGPATVMVEGQPVVTNSATVTVTEPPPALEEDMVATAEVSINPAWEGQVVLYRYGLRSRVRVLRSRWSGLPVTQLARPRDGGAVRRQYMVEDARGPTWVDETLEPFIVTSAGDITLAPVVVQVDVPREGRRSPFDPFDFPEQRSLLTKAMELSVRPLPPPPVGFSGLVGEFEFSSTIVDTKVAVGESVDWTVDVTGDGSLEGFHLPPPQDLEGARIYDGSPSVSAVVEESGYRASGTFNRVVVPTEPGTLRLPPLEVKTFSTTRGEYVVHRLELPVLEVAPGGEQGGAMESFAPLVVPQTQAEAPQVVDIYPVYAKGRTTAPFLGPVLPWAVLVAAAGGLLALLLDLRVWMRLLLPPREAVAAPMTPVDRLRRLPEDADEQLDLLDDALRQSLGRRLNLPPGQLDRREAIEQLPASVRDRVAAVSNALERARFAGDPPGSDLADQVRSVVQDLWEAA